MSIGAFRWEKPWKGISYTSKNSICYSTNANILGKYNSLKSTNVPSESLAIDKDSTNIYSLYNDVCCQGTDSCYIPVSLSPETLNKEYFLIFHVVNPSDLNETFQFYS